MEGSGYLKESDKIKLQEKELTALDGLWFLEVEKEWGYEAANKINREVWRRCGPILVREMKKMFHIEGKTFDEVRILFGSIMELDGTAFTFESPDDQHLVVKISRCVWYENLKRAGRHELHDCMKIDLALLPTWLEAINPRLVFDFGRAIPKGDEFCEIVLRYENG